MCPRKLWAKSEKRPATCARAAAGLTSTCVTAGCITSKAIWIIRSIAACFAPKVRPASCSIICRPEQKHLLLYLKGIGDIDLASANAVCEEAERCRAHGGALYIIARYPPRLKQLKKLNVIDHIGEGRILDNKGHAISAIVPQLDGSICAICRARVFFECSKQPGGSACTRPEPFEAT